jgi:hypothetical protein
MVYPGTNITFSNYSQWARVAPCNPIAFPPSMAVIPDFAYMDVGGRAMQEQLPRSGTGMTTLTSILYVKSSPISCISR